MIVDSSVLIHIAFGEPGWEESLRWLSEQPHLSLCEASLIERHAVFSRQSTRALRYTLDELVLHLDIEVVAFGAGQARLAQQAYDHYGNGRGHPAQLNFGDVMVYALSKAEGETLAFVETDFSHTDLETVRLPLG